MVKTSLSFLLSKLGYKIERTGLARFAKDMDSGFRSIWKDCASYTMTSIERTYGLYKTVEYVVNAKIPGVFVETGVWRGGSVMAAALSFQRFGDTSREFYLYDTFEGMSEPSLRDAMIGNNYPAKRLWETFRNRREQERWMCYASLEEVRKSVLSTSYPENKFTFVKGKVEDTLPGVMPEEISILRIDTDWYNSTYHALKHLFPLLSSGGVLILDDYGHWRGAREAADQYFEEEKVSIFLNRIDGAGRIGIKM